MPITTSNLIKERLLIINPEYTQAMETGRSTRFIPKMLPLFSAPIYMKKKKTHLDQVAIARAPKVFVPQGVRAYYPNETDKHKQHPEYIFPTFNGELRQEQVDIVDKLIKHRYAFGHISTGVGKTYIQCEIIRRLKRKTLIVVDTTSALSQMEKQIKTILDIDVCLPNKKKHKDSPITVWNIHSLHKLDLQSYGLVLYDEADTFLGSENYRHTINQVDSEYAYAVTGTIKVNHYPENIFNIFYGPKESLIKKLMTPRYIQVSSNFNEASFKHFADLKGKLYDNEERNQLILDTLHSAMKTHNKALVFTEYIEHAELLKEACESLGYKTYLLIGKVKADERERIRIEVADYPGKCIIVGSVELCGRGFDCPPLDLAINTTSVKFDSRVEQYFGRIIRLHPSKTSATFIDIVDYKCRMFVKQGKERLKMYQESFPS